MGRRKSFKSRAHDAMSDFEKAFVKAYSEEELQVLRTLGVEELKQRVADANAHVMKSKKEMQANPNYMSAEETLKDFRGAFNEAKKHADAKKNMCLQLLDAQGVVDIGESNSEEA
jgi:uncharacterized small protein (DUF1192 family)